MLVDGKRASDKRFVAKCHCFLKSFNVTMSHRGVRGWESGCYIVMIGIKARSPLSHV